MSFSISASKLLTVVAAFREDAQVLSLADSTHQPPEFWRLFLWLWVSYCFVVKTQLEFSPKKHPFLWLHGLSFTVGWRWFAAAGAADAPVLAL